MNNATKTLIYVIKRKRRCEKTTLGNLASRTKEHKIRIVRLVYRAPVAPSGSGIYIFIDKGTDSDGRCVCVCVPVCICVSMCVYVCTARPRRLLVIKKIEP